MKIKLHDFFHGLSMCLLLTSLSVSSSARVVEDTILVDSTSTNQKQEQLGQQGLVRSFKTVPSGQESIIKPPTDFLATSEILCFNGLATFVPKRAVIRVPKTYSSRLVMDPEAQVKTWKEFYLANRGWITTLEVTRNQAEGNVPLAEAAQEQMSKSGNLTVATFQGNPISVLPLKVPASQPANTTNSKLSKP